MPQAKKKKERNPTKTSQIKAYYSGLMQVRALQTHADDALNLNLNAGATSEFSQPKDSPPYPSRSTRTPLLRTYGMEDDVT